MVQHSCDRARYRAGCRLALTADGSAHSAKGQIGPEVSSPEVVGAQEVRAKTTTSGKFNPVAHFPKFHIFATYPYWCQLCDKIVSSDHQLS
jgi:hypothetical protein